MRESEPKFSTYLRDAQTDAKFCLSCGLEAIPQTTDQCPACGSARLLPYLTGDGDDEPIPEDATQARIAMARYRREREERSKRMRQAQRIAFGYAKLAATIKGSKLGMSMSPSDLRPTAVSNIKESLASATTIAEPTRKPNGFWRSESTLAVLRDVIESRTTLETASVSLGVPVGLVSYYARRLQKSDPQ